MNIRESNIKLTKICRLFEEHVANIVELQNLTLDVELLFSFDNLPETRMGTVETNPAAYRKSTNKIYVNSATFFFYTEDIQKAFIAHEVGHAFRILSDAHIETIESIEIHECIIADRLACEWGFFEPLKMERLRSYGQEYVECLNLWQDIDAFNKCMGTWQMQLRSGQLSKQF